MKVRYSNEIRDMVLNSIPGSFVEQQLQFETTFNCKIIGELDTLCDQIHWYVVFNSDADYNYFLISTQ